MFTSMHLQAWVDHPSMYLAVGDYYHFEASAADGSDVTLVFNLQDVPGGNVTVSISNGQLFTSLDTFYTFTG